jgi:hypothetical protein
MRRIASDRDANRQGAVQPPRTRRALAIAVLCVAILLLFGLILRKASLSPSAVSDPYRQSAPLGVPANKPKVSVSDLESGAADGQDRQGVPSSGDAAPSTRITPSIRVRFLAQSDSAIAGVDIHLDGPLRVVQSTSDEQGEVSLSPEIPTDAGKIRCRIIATKTGFVSDERTCLVGPHEAVDLGNWHLQYACTVSGSVSSHSGLPIANAQVAEVNDHLSEVDWDLRRRDPLSTLQGKGPAALSGPDGRFLLAGIPIGRHRLVATANDKLATLSDEFDVERDEIRSGIQIVMDDTTVSSTISGVIVGVNGSAVPGARVTLHGAQMTTQTRADEGGLRLAL